MAQDYAAHLAATVLSDGKFISYRLLSRERKVHSNVAKKMLYDFHRMQNAKMRGSVHATYLLDGTPKSIVSESQTNGHPTDGEDTHMQSSPFMSSAAQQENKEGEFAIPSRSVILAREEDLEAAKSKLDVIHSIHIYSLQPNVLQNLQTLSDCNHTISTTFNAEDPLVAGQRYGVIHNNEVRRKTARRPLRVALSVVASKKVEKITPKPSPKVPEFAKAESKTDSSSSQESTMKLEKTLVDRPPSKPSGKPPALKKEQSDIFKSFSKPKTTLKREAADSSTVESPAPSSHENEIPQKDEPMRDAYDGEQEEKFVTESKTEPKVTNTGSQRAEQLRKMMDEDDEEMEGTDKGAIPETSQDLTATGERASQKEPTPEAAPVVSGGRRRGRRKIIKKKTIKDEEGYLVTKEEPAWESFSEDEPGPQKERAPHSAAASSKGKKTGGGKPGQGNITSFFGKK